MTTWIYLELGAFLPALFHTTNHVSMYLFGYSEFKADGDGIQTELEAPAGLQYLQSDWSSNVHT